MLTKTKTKVVVSVLDELLLGSLRGLLLPNRLLPNLLQQHASLLYPLLRQLRLTPIPLFYLQTG